MKPAEIAVQVSSDFGQIPGYFFARTVPATKPTVIINSK